MCKAFESNPPLPDGEPQTEASEEPAPQQSSQKRKGKETFAEEPKKKKSKPSDPLPKASGGLKIGSRDDPSTTNPR